ncbi:ethanolamine utilization protein EutJ [Lutispora thermophila]|uniref:Ethanolamine utilization protein EutJ n=1 Tax=Lutispora thermophila DSM 19022 TaxID=1122184 RepID=A0A1M6FIY8_9FIRM|nr:ethanolamine utilization protein EutJ [Lutispora thermophila]SHI97681.1 ethanolamine utilization protein EutJ [Lutispora thermophila DSM 19022]
MVDFCKADSLIMEVEETLTNNKDVEKNLKLKVGVDLGTSHISITVLDRFGKPVACAMEEARVVRDGLVVDYMGAQSIVKRLKMNIEDRVGVELAATAIAIPPGTGKRDSDTHRYVVEGAGIEVVSIVDEPTAANMVLGIKDGVVVDIGAGTTGLSIFEDGNVVYTADEPTGGTHLSLVIAGNYKIPFEEADKIKKDKSRHKEIRPLILPVVQKIASIINNHIRGFKVNDIYLVGGTSCLTGIEDIIKTETGINAVKPYNPLLVTPVGIALSCSL